MEPARKDLWQDRTASESWVKVTAVSACEQFRNGHLADTSFNMSTTLISYVPALLEQCVNISLTE